VAPRHELAVIRDPLWLDPEIRSISKENAYTEAMLAEPSRFR
jgi:hypothetical protein